MTDQVIGHGRDETPGVVAPGPALPENRAPTMKERRAHDAPLLRAAARVVGENQFGSARYVARKLGVSQEKAADLMLDLEERGWVGRYNNGLARDVLIRAEHVEDALDKDFPKAPEGVAAPGETPGTPTPRRSP